MRTLSRLSLLLPLVLAAGCVAVGDGYPGPGYGHGGYGYAPRPYYAAPARYHAPPPRYAAPRYALPRHWQDGRRAERGWHGHGRQDRRHDRDG